MPFKSRQQEVACYASDGFGGEVDCKEWSDKTDRSKLPKKVKKSSHGVRQYMAYQGLLAKEGSTSSVAEPTPKRPSEVPVESSADRRALVPPSTGQSTPQMTSDKAAQETSITGLSGTPAGDDNSGTSTKLANSGKGHQPMRKEAAAVAVTAFIDDLCTRHSMDKQAQLRIVQANLADGHDLVDSIKGAYPASSEGARLKMAHLLASGAAKIHKEAMEGGGSVGVSGSNLSSGGGSAVGGFDHRKKKKEKEEY